MWLLFFHVQCLFKYISMTERIKLVFQWWEWMVESEGNQEYWCLAQHTRSAWLMTLFWAGLTQLLLPPLCLAVLVLIFIFCSHDPRSPRHHHMSWILLHSTVMRSSNIAWRIGQHTDTYLDKGTGVGLDNLFFLSKNEWSDGVVNWC